VSNLWQEEWERNFSDALTRSPEFDPRDYYRSGRASKAYPDKEDPAWWAENGPRFVSLWETWRDNSGLKFSEFPDKDGVAFPGIELEVYAQRDDLIVKSVIDRVMEDANGNLYIIDIKTGSRTDPWPLQMVLNNLGLFATYGVRATYAGFWSARKGGVDQWHDMTIYDDEWAWDLVRKAKAIRDQQLFLPNPGSLCTSACGVKDYCRAMGGRLSFFETDATITQGEG
jgi:hypothetical protein